MKWNSIFFSICLAAWAYLLPTRSAGQTWNLQTTGLTLNGIWMLNSSTGWAVGDFGTIWHSSDQLGILKRTAPLTDNRLDLSGPLTGIYCLWLLDSNAEARVARW